jgi:hypothetical protein
MTGQPSQRAIPARLVAAIILAAVVISASVIATSYLGTATTVTRTTTLTTTTTFTTTVMSTQSCVGQPVWNTNSSEATLPVLLMQPNSTGYACVTYQSGWKGNPINITNTAILNTEYPLYPLEIGNEVCVSQDGETSCTWNASHSFNNSVYPQSVLLTGSTDYVNVLYTITALSNSTGIYSGSVPFYYCSSMPLAVGYTASQLNASGFAQRIPIPSTPCPALALVPVSVSVTGMGVAYFDL